MICSGLRARGVVGFESAECLLAVPISQQVGERDLVRGLVVVVFVDVVVVKWQIQGEDYE